MELYTADRGIALGTAANGSIDTNAHAALAQLVNEQFQPTAAITIAPPATTGEPDMGALALALRQCDKIVTAPEGERNHTLNTAAYTLGGMVGAGRISREDARAALIAAVQRAGWGNLPLQISKIDQAIERIENGTYGYCEESGEPIGLRRLEARPIATMSIEAQERHERMERVHRDD